MDKLKIGNVNVENRVFLAPMAGVTDEAFFYIAKKYGVGLLYSEMVSDKGIIYDNEKTMSMLEFDESLHPYVLQLFGSDPDELLRAAKIVLKVSRPDIIDINMGCSVHKILRSDSGAALLKDPNKVYEIVHKLTSNIDIPVTVKIRSGIDHEHINYIEVGQAAEKGGAAAITLHPRCKSDLFRGKANYEHIKKLKETLSIPVIASGDIKTKEDAKRVFEETGCDAIMIGRAAMGNPFIFKEIVSYLDGIPFTPISKSEKLQTLEDHFLRLLAQKGEKVACLQMRSHAAWYVKGMKDATVFKAKLNSITNKEDFLKLLNDFRSIEE